MGVLSTEEEGEEEESALWFVEEELKQVFSSNSGTRGVGADRGARVLAGVIRFLLTSEVSLEG